MKSNRRFGWVAGMLLLLAAGRAEANSSMNRSLFAEGYQMIFQMDAENRPNVDGAIAAFSRVIAEDSVPDDPALWQVFAWRGYCLCGKGRLRRTK